ncbi:short-chain dehydrogenase [Moniliophthora roreri MCA 2997]|uniref:Short-chain dehydrogenase n=2 Tax=Moniliophthora roreri TaxID=221103 RepID=V2XBY5_MONRO|nr:short-chain dehydrogenase [Moniliophthora roreri MCA 2997]KAI3612035.1 short-chain dehydrogenase [Moniliophthora roreri]
MSLEHLKASSLGDLSGRVALVTGGGTGIGLMMAKSFLANGAKVYITGRRLETLQKTAKEFPGLITLQMDVTSKDSIAAAAKVVEANDGRLDILVNNAGVPGQMVSLETKSYGDSHFTEESFERWTSVLSTNTTAIFFVTMGFLNLLEKGAEDRRLKGRGGETSSVINISSSGGDSHVSLGIYSYMVSKAALNYLTEILATEFALKKIPVRVNVLLPGLFPSEMAPNMPNGTESSPMPALPGAINPIPLQRAGREEEIGIAAVYLASDAGSYTNGAHLRVDGGHYLVNP